MTLLQPFAWIFALSILSSSSAADSQDKSSTKSEQLSLACLQQSNLAACAERLLMAQKLQEADGGIEFAKKLCEGGVLTGCSQVADLFPKDEAEASKWLARACAGDTEVDARGCAMRADLAERHLQPAAAARFRSYACKAGLPSACAASPK